MKANIFIKMNYLNEGGLSYDIAPCDYFPESKVHYGFPVSNNVLVIHVIRIAIMI